MTASGELLNLPVVIPMRNPASAYHPPRRRGAAACLSVQPPRVYVLPRHRRLETFGYAADGYTRTAPDKGSIIDLFA